MDTTGVILLAGIGLVVGFLVGALIFSLRREPDQKHERTQQSSPGADNQVRIWREGPEEHLVVAFKGVTYRQGSNLEGEPNRVLTNLEKDLQVWLNVPPVEATPTTAQVVMPDQDPVRSEDVQQKTSFNPLKIFGDALTPKKKSGIDQQDQSIVAQIDQILQSKIEGTNLEDKGIRLVEGPDQGMLIEVGLNKYTDIEAVPDGEVRQLIRISVAEWERNLGE